MHWISNRRLWGCAALLALFPLWTACAARTEVRQLGTSLALRGQQVCDAALDGYRALEDQQRIDRQQQELVRILIHPQPDHLKPLPFPDPEPFEEQIRLRVRAFSKLREAYLQLQLLADEGSGMRAEQASRTVLESAQAIQGLPGLSEELRRRLSGLSGQLAQSIQSRHIRRRNAAFLELLQVYRQLWEADLPVWKEYLQSVHDDFAQGLSSVPADRFNSSQLNKVLKVQPFVAPVQVALYKRDLQVRSAEQELQLRRRLEAVSRALAALESAHLELSKHKPSLSETLQVLALAGGILEDIRSMSKKEEER